MVVIADHTCDLPCSFLVLLEVNTPALAHTNFLVAGMMKAMDAGLERTVALHVEGLQGTGNEFASSLTADVLLYTRGQRIPSSSTEGRAGVRPGLDCLRTANEITESQRSNNIRQPFGLGEDHFTRSDEARIA